jgi:transcriptional antiterminator RfaH
MWTFAGASQAVSAPFDDKNGSDAGDPACQHSGSRPGLRWFLVFTKPLGEKIAQVNLERQGYRVYYPRLLHPSLYRGHWVERIVSLFPRYMFLQLDTAWQSLGPVRSTVGVANVVQSGREFTIVPDDIVERLMLRADPTSGLHKLDGVARFHRGAKVNVIAGPFEGLDGIFEREAGEDRVVIMLKLLGQDATVRVSSRYVVPAASR